MERIGVGLHVERNLRNSSAITNGSSKSEIPTKKEGKFAALKKIKKRSMDWRVATQG